MLKSLMTFRQNFMSVLAFPQSWVTRVAVSPVLAWWADKPSIGQSWTQEAISDPVGGKTGTSTNINHRAQAFSQTDRQRDRWEKSDYLDRPSRQTDTALLLSICHDGQDRHMWKEARGPCWPIRQHALSQKWHGQNYISKIWCKVAPRAYSVRWAENKRIALNVSKV